MRSIIILNLILFCSFIFSADAKISKYKKGDLISEEVKLNKKRSISLPEGQWEVYYRSTEHAAGMKFSILELGKIEDNEISEFFSIGYANMAGMHIMYVDPILNEIIFKDPYDGCYERPEYFLLELFRKGSTHNCFKVGHVDVNKELYNPDDKFNRGYLAAIKRYLRENSEAEIPRIMLGSFHSYFSRPTGGDWILISRVINPKKLNGPESKYFTEDTSEYHKYNIKNFPKHEATMKKWISIASLQHQELEKLSNSKSFYNLKLDKYILNEADDKKFTNQNLTDELKSLNDLYKSGSLTKDEFEKAKKKILD